MAFPEEFILQMRIKSEFSHETSKVYGMSPSAEKLVLEEFKILHLALFFLAKIADGKEEKQREKGERRNVLEVRCNR